MNRLARATALVGLLFACGSPSPATPGADGEPTRPASPCAVDADCDDDGAFCTGDRALRSRRARRRCGRMRARLVALWGG